MTHGTHLKILMVAAEAVPFAKEGGVADVIGSLPKELAALGHDVRIFLPRYGTIDPAYWALKPTGVARTFFMAGFDQTVSLWQATLPDSPVIVYLLEHEWFFGRH
ncbi:MAG TPA: glycogen/starch synthase, partial [Ktedonobacteraceae bacterium]